MGAIADHRALPLSVVDPRQDYEELRGSSVSLADVVVVDSGGVDDDFDRVVSEAVLALESGVQAELISAGSSGCYFVKDPQKVTVIIIVYYLRKRSAPIRLTRYAYIRALAGP